MQATKCKESQVRLKGSTGDTIETKDEGKRTLKISLTQEDTGLKYKYKWKTGTGENHEEWKNRKGKDDCTIGNIN